MKSGNTTVSSNCEEEIYQFMYYVSEKQYSWHLPA